MVNRHQCASVSMEGPRGRARTVDVWSVDRGGLGAGQLLTTSRDHHMLSTVRDGAGSFANCMRVQFAQFGGQASCASWNVNLPGVECLERSSNLLNAARCQ